MYRCTRMKKSITSLHILIQVYLKTFHKYLPPDRIQIFWKLQFHEIHNQYDCVLLSRHIRVLEWLYIL